MDKILSGEQQLLLNSCQQSEQTLTLTAKEKSTLIVKIEGDQPYLLNIHAQAEPSAVFTLLIINDNKASLTINDEYRLKKGSENVIAYCALNPDRIETHSNYFLDEEHSSLRVLSVSLSEQLKQFNQDVLHNASETFAQIDNFGVVQNEGDCRMIVRNRINKGMKNCETHQSNRLLTCDKQSKAKVLPVLYIDDNEVAASHGCSLGQPDEEQIYYLMSRGLSRKEALQLITIGYLMPITKITSDEKINTILKEQIESRVMLHEED